MKKCTILLMVSLLLSSRLIAQDSQEAPKIKFEKVSDEELTMKTYPNDTTAEAVILYDNGYTFFKYDTEKGFMLTHERFVRIKILKQSGVDWGNFSIALYSFNSTRDEMSTPKGTTFNLENGKVVKSELKKDAIFRERQNRYYETVRLSMPMVKVGSVIDLKYSIRTEQIWNLRTWQFQYTIPVKWSQYQVVYPEYFTYNQSSLGYHPLLYAKTDRKPESINYTTREESAVIGLNGNAGRGQISNQSIPYQANVFDYAAKDVPAIKTEPFLTTLDNYTTQVKFELSNTNFTMLGGSFKNYTTSWIDIAKQLNENENFGLQLKGNGFIEDAVAELTKGTTDEQKKSDLIYNHVQRTMKWDGHKTLYTDKSLKKAYSDKTGSSAEINLLLAVMLNKAGIKANPVILSTRENGILNPVHASISDCNYVIVQAIVNDKPILLDATESNLQAGLIPFRCLNGEGHMIKNDESEPVKLSNPKSVENTLVQLEIKEGKMIGSVDKRVYGLSASDFRKGVKLAGSSKEYFDKIKNSSTDLNYIEYQYKNLDSLNQPVQIVYKIALKEGQDGDAGIIYIDPVLIVRQKNNPFTSPTREYPVDFGVPYSEAYNMQLTIPEGYKVEELPKSKSLALPEGGGRFQYQVIQIDNKIVLNFRLSIDKPLFIPSEYPYLKEFFNLVINKEAEQIILKKTTI
ncbi:MAG: DUF3857 domain-containing protein [Bacteroidia bacterium]|nr:DUF3857 domain-containing protein [Bacteroidia bacterium]